MNVVSEPVIPSENIVRRRLWKLGYRLIKARVRNPDHPWFGGYIVVDPSHGGAVFGTYGTVTYTASLEDVVEWLNEVVEEA